MSNVVQEKLVGIVEAGQPAPSFQLPAQDGKVVSLEGYRGKWVVLYFFVKANTSG